MKNQYKFVDANRTIKETLYDGFLEVAEVEVQHKLFNGKMSKPLRREIVMRGETVAALVFDPEMEAVLMVEQYRVGIIDGESPWCFELPAGVIDVGEAPEVAIARELEEETGLCITPQNATGELYSSFYPSAGGCTEKVNIFYIQTSLEGLDGTIGGEESEGEDIRVHVVPMDRLWAMLNDGTIRTGTTMLALEKFRSALLTQSLDHARQEQEQMSAMLTNQIQTLLENQSEGDNNG